MPGIHPSAIVDLKAELDPSVEVGAYALIGPNVRIGAGSSIHPFAQVVGHTELGENNVVHSHCVIGGPPQDKKYQGEPTKVQIGSGNTFRECCTINSGTAQDAGTTRIGDHNWVMAYVHIAHDCVVGSNTIMANATQIGGHVVVGDWAILGGLTGIHQFVKIGAHAMTAAGTTLTQDLPPYVMAGGNPAAAHGINSEGLRRRGFSGEQIACIKRAYRLLYKTGMGLEQTIDALSRPACIGAVNASEQSAIAVLTDFLSTVSRGIVR